MYSNQQIAKENMLDALRYLYSNHLLDSYILNHSSEELIDKLTMEGFAPDAIYKALDWLDNLARQQNEIECYPTHTKSLRVFSNRELQKISTAARGFIMELEQLALLNNTTRELVISQTMALDAVQVGLEQVQWVILMILLRQQDQQNTVLCVDYIMNNMMERRRNKNAKESGNC